VGPLELALILLAVLVLFGHQKLPDASRALGRSLRIFTRELRGLKDDDTVEPTAPRGENQPGARPADSDRRGAMVPGSADLQGGAAPPSVQALQPGGHSVGATVAPGDGADLGHAVHRLRHVHPPDDQGRRAAGAPVGAPPR